MAINRELLRAKGCYFTGTAGSSALLPFVASIALQFGGTPAVIGIMYSIIPFVILVSKLVFGGVVDKYHRKKLFVCVFSVISSSAMFAIYFIPPLSTDPMPVAVASRTSDVDGDGSSVAVTVICEESRPTGSGNSLTFCLSNGMPEGNADTWPWSSAVNASVAHEPSIITCDLACPRQSLRAAFVEHSGANATRCHTTSDDYCRWTAAFDAASSNRKEGPPAGDDAFSRPQCGTFSLVATKDPSDIGLFCWPDVITTTVLNCSLLGRCRRHAGDGEITEAAPFSTTLSPLPPHRSFYDKFKALNFNFQIKCLWICLIVGVAAGATTTMIVDTLVIDMLEDKRMFGRQRLWGSVGWGIFSVVSGFIIDLVSPSKSRLNFTPAIFLFVALHAVSLGFAMTFRVSTAKKQRKIFQNVGSILRKPQIGVFTVTNFFFGCMTAINRTFVIVYLNKMGAPQFLIGLSLTVQCFLSEVPCFFLANVIIKKIGHINCVSLSVGVMAVRLLLYSVIPNPWWVLPVQLAHGITFGLYVVTLSTFPALVAPPGIQTTMQAIFHGLYEGLGVGVGSLVGGTLYHVIGGKMMFMVAGLTSAGLSLTYTVLQYYLRKKLGDAYLYVQPGNNKDLPEVEKMMNGNDRELQDVDGILKEKLEFAEKAEKEQLAIREP